MSIGREWECEQTNERWSKACIHSFPVLSVYFCAPLLKEVANEFKMIVELLHTRASYLFIISIWVVNSSSSLLARLSSRMIHWSLANHSFVKQAWRFHIHRNLTGACCKQDHRWMVSPRVFGVVRSKYSSNCNWALALLETFCPTFWACFQSDKKGKFSMSWRSATYV